MAVDKPLTLLSVNGPEFTIIEGYQLPDVINGDGAIRCVYLTNDAILSGFTLIGGAGDRSGILESAGGGVWCQSSDALVFNCVITSNSAPYYAGGAYRGTLYDCVLTGNKPVAYGFGGSVGGGAIGSTLYGCTLTKNSADTGGGASDCILYNCTITDNEANDWGGGAFRGVLVNCTVTGNSAERGGGVFGGTLDNCVLVGNTAKLGGGALGVPASSSSYQATLNNCTVVSNHASIKGGGADGGVLNNCIVYYNSSPDQPNYSTNSVLDYACTTPLPSSGIGNITNAPLFVDTNGWVDVRLQPNSPCINAGNNAYVTSTNDLDGNPRIVGGTVDMGAYEFQSPQSVISYAWLQQYNLPTDGSADFAHSDADPHNNWQEWKTWTDPTDELSFLRMLNPEPGTNGTVVSWQSEAGHSYFVERATDAASSFSVLQSNITGQAGMTSFTDTNTVHNGAALYRVGVE